MKKEKENKSEKQKPLSAREAAQDFIRPFVIKGDTMPLHPSTKLRHETEEYSAEIDGEFIVITKLHGAEVKEEFTVSEIMLDVTMEYCYKTGISNISASTAQEVYEKRAKEIKRLLKCLNEKMKGHGEKFKKNSLNWGYVGDLAHVGKQLGELVSFLK
ncbi:MAG: hypothetical protein HY063_05935 [Bacteroidetes bacterium]|nr:hypothetical protein [Bacteroidota bacterium]